MEKREALELEQKRISEQGPEFFEQRKPLRKSDCHVVVKFPVKGPDLLKVFEAEKLLLDAGVDFDTGYGFGVREWCFDWSLEGAVVYRLKMRKWATRRNPPKKPDTSLPARPSKRRPPAK